MKKKFAISRPSSAIAVTATKLQNGPKREVRHAVVYSCDGSYWEHLYVSLFSLLTSNRDLAFDVYVITSSPDEVFRGRVKRLKQIHGDVNVEFVSVEETSFPDAPLVMSHFTIATYYRLLLGRLLPLSIDRALYLDVDTIVRASLRNYLSLDLDGDILAATPAYFSPAYECIYGSNAARLGMPEGSPYFNAGVLLIDLEKWRRFQVEEQCINFIRSNSVSPEKLKYADQDPLNVVLAGKWKSVGPQYNYVEFTADDPRRFVEFPPQHQFGGEIPEEGPAIVHFADAEKPWNSDSPHRYASNYWDYRMQTPYADYRNHLRIRVLQKKNQVRQKIGVLTRRLPWGESIVRAAKYVLRA